MAKLQYNKGAKQYTLNIPKDLVNFKRWKKGEEFEIIENDKGEIVLQPKRRKNS